MLVPIAGGAVNVVIGTLGRAIVAYFIFLLIDKRNTVIPRNIPTVVIGVAYALSILAASTTLLSLNLARDLSPRLAATIKIDAWKGQPYIACKMGMSLLFAPITCWLHDMIMLDYKRSVHAGQAEIMGLEKDREAWNGLFKRARARYRKAIISRKDDPEFRKMWAIPEPWLKIPPRTEIAGGRRDRKSVV